MEMRHRPGSGRGGWGLPRVARDRGGLGGVSGGGLAAGIGRAGGAGPGMAAGVVFIGTLAAMLAIAMLSCAPLQQGSTGTLSLRFSVHESIVKTAGTAESRDIAGARTFMPAESAIPSRYMVTGTGPGMSVLSLEVEAGMARAMLIPGDWNLIVTGYSAEGKEVGTGNCTVTIRPGQVTNNEVTVFPIEGTGDLSITIMKNFQLPAGFTYTGKVVYKGLPGRPDAPAQADQVFDIPAEESSRFFGGIRSGYYTISISLKQADGTIVGGCVETAFVMAGTTTSGTCQVIMGAPELNLEPVLFPSEPLEAPLMSADLMISTEAEPIPLAVPPEGSQAGVQASTRWYANGTDQGEGYDLANACGFIPQGTVVYPFTGIGNGVRFFRADCIALDEATGRSSNGIGWIDIRDGPTGGGALVWKATYDYMAIMGSSLTGPNTGNDTGTCEAYPVKALASSGSGLLAISGLDGEAAIHLFAVAYGAEAVSPDGSDRRILPAETPWMRLWRDRIQVGGDYKTADRLAISDDGSYIAAASSASGWLKIYALGPDGGISDSWEFTESGLGLTGHFSYLKALSFSPDSQTLYVLSSSTEGVHRFDLSSGEPVYVSSQLVPRDGAQTLSFQDMTVMPSGTVVVSSKDLSKLYFFDYTDGVWTYTTIEGSTGGLTPYHPAKLVKSARGDSFYVLCNGTSIARFSRTSATEPYARAGSFTLDAALSGSSLMTGGVSISQGAGLSESLCVGAPGKLGCVVFTDGVPGATYSLLPDPGDRAGIATAACIEFAKGVLVLGSFYGTYGTVSVFDVE